MFKLTSYFTFKARAHDMPWHTCLHYGGKILCSTHTHTHTSKIDCLIWRWHIIKNNPFNHFGRLFLPICWTPLIFKRIIRVKRTSTMTIFHVYNFERVSEEKQNYFPTLWDFLIVRSSHSSPGEIFKFTGWMVTFRSCETLAILLESPFMCALFEEK